MAWELALQANASSQPFVEIVGSLAHLTGGSTVTNMCVDVKSGKLIAVNRWQVFEIDPETGEGARVAGSGMRGTDDETLANSAFRGPTGVTTTPAGLIYVADYGTVRCIDRERNRVWSLVKTARFNGADVDEELTINLDGVLYHRGRLYVSDQNVHCCDPETGKLVWSLPSPLTRAKGMAIAPDGSLLVCECGVDQAQWAIVQIDVTDPLLPSRTLWRASSHRELQRPTWVSSDAVGGLFVDDYQLDRETGRMVPVPCLYGSLHLIMCCTPDGCLYGRNSNSQLIRVRRAAVSVKEAVGQFLRDSVEPCLSGLLPPPLLQLIASYAATPECWSP